MKTNIITINNIIVAEEKNKKKALKLLSFFKGQSKNAELKEIIMGE